MDDSNVNSAVCSTIASELGRAGLRLAVISPGSRSSPLALAFEREPGIDTEVILDERSAAFFALGAAASTGRPSVLVCTSGTAVANYFPGVAEADLAGVPMILLTGDRPPELRETGAGQVIDQVKIFGGAVRWFSEVGPLRGDDEGLLHARQVASRAWAAAVGDPRPGPVHLNFPMREPLAPVPGPDPLEVSSRLARDGRADGPFTRVRGGVGLPPESVLDEAVETLGDLDRVMIIVGLDRDATLRGPITELAAQLDAPVLAEPTSQLRWGPHDRSRIVWDYDRILSESRPELEPGCVIRIGEMPTSARLRRWLASLELDSVLMLRPEGDWHDPSRSAGLIVRSDPSATLSALAERLPAAGSRAFLDEWLGSQISPPQPEDDGAPTPAGIHLAVAGAAGDGTVVYVSSSLAIRELEALLPPGQTDIRFLSNRGANGIDGLIASAAGAARSSADTVFVVTGDLGLLHDQGSLGLIARPGLDVRVVVINDGGGRIFDRLPVKDAITSPEFERLMLTPQTASFASVAEAAGVTYALAEDPESLREALDRSGPLLVEVPLQR